MNKFNTKILVLLFFAFIVNVKAQTLIINEVSNGASGSSQEYIELVVVSNSAVYDCSSSTPPCIDIRGWIVDDNNDYHGTSGTAPGAVRFSQNAIWSCVPLGTIILIYNNFDRNPAIPADDLSMADGNCRIIAPMNNTTLFEGNATTPGAVACSYPATGWIPGGNWTNNTALDNTGDCMRIVNLAGCEVFSLCYGTDNLNNLIYFSGGGSQKVYYFNNGDPTQQSNWTVGSSSTNPGDQTPGATNNAANASYIAQFNNNCTPITPINVSAIPVNTGCACTGSATATATGSIGGYTYVWYDASYSPIGQTSATATNLCAGVYNVIAKSSINCLDTATVTISASTTLSVNVNTATICAGQNASLTATNATTYLWSNGTTNGNLNVNPLTTTTYTVTGTTGSCTGSVSAVVTVNSLPTISTSSATICKGQNSTLTVSGANTYVWSTTGTGSNISVTPNTSTTYTITGTTGSCTGSVSAVVTVNSLPTISTSSSTICKGQNSTLTVSGANTYLWSNGATDSNISVTPNASTTYTITGTNSNGCTNAITVNVTVNSQPTIVVNSPTICSGSSVILNASGATNYVWSTGDMTANISVTPTAASTTYTITGTTLGCSNTAMSVVSWSSSSMVSVNSATICVGESTCLTATGGNSYLWSTGDANPIACVTPAISTTYTVTALMSNNINAVVNGDFENGYTGFTTDYTIGTGGSWGQLSDPGTYAITTDANLVHSNFENVPDHTLSPGVNYFIVNGASGSGTKVWCQTMSVIPGETYVFSCWVTNVETTNTVPELASLNFDIDGVNIGSFFSPPLGAPQWVQYTTSWTCPTGTTSITLCIEDSNLSGGGNDFGLDDISFQMACTSVTTAVVTVNNPPVVTITPSVSTINCITPSATLTANGGATYAWSTGVNNTTINVSPTLITTYTVTATTNSGCSAIATQLINVDITPPTATVTPTATIDCNTPDAILTAGIGAGYLWSTGTTQNSITVNTGGTYTVTVIGSNGCVASATSIVTAIPVPIASFNTSPTSGTPPLTVTFTNTSQNANTYLWSFGDNTSATTLDATTIYGTTGNYEVILTATDGNCIDTASITIVVYDNYYLFIPNVFTPNNDNTNDIFTITSKGLTTLDAEIYDRWGLKLYEWHSVTGGWDGKNAVDGTYYFIIKAKGFDTIEHIEKGSFSLIK